MRLHAGFSGGDLMLMLVRLVIIHSSVRAREATLLVLCPLAAPPGVPG